MHNAWNVYFCQYVTTLKDCNKMWGCKIPVTYDHYFTLS